MRLSENIIFRIILLVAVLLMSSNVLAQDQSPGDEAYSAEEKSAPAVPDLADIVPLASALSGRLATLKNKLSDQLDIAAVEKSGAELEESLRGIAELEESLRGIAEQLKDNKDSPTQSYSKLVAVKQSLEKKEHSLTTVTKPLRESIRQLGVWRKEWSDEKENWTKWESYFLEEEKVHELKSTFVNAGRSIDEALNLLSPQLKELLAAQKKAGSIDEKILSLTAELDSLKLVVRRGVLLDESPPMYSSKYFSQFGGDLWHASKAGLSEISLSTAGLLDRLGLIVFFEIIIFLAVILAIFRNRRKLQDSVRWKFLGARPISAGFFVCIVSTMWFYEYEGISPAWTLATEIVGGISLARLLSVLLESTWRRHFIYGVLPIWILARLIYFIQLPLPLSRLYTVAAAVLAVMFFRKWAQQSQDNKESLLYAWSLRFGALFFVFVILVQVAGKETLAALLFLSSLRSIVEVIGFLLLLRVLIGALEGLLKRFVLRHIKPLHGKTDDGEIVRRVRVLIGFLGVAVMLTPYLLMIWGRYDTFQEALSGFLALGIPLGTQELTVAHLIIVAVVLYGTFLVSGILQELLLDEVLIRRRMEKGVRISIARLVHYLLLFVSFLLVLWILNFEFTKVVIVFSALGVGIGFGLQSIVNNFLSGLILLFERPIRVGDSLEFGGQWVEVKHIGLRATTVQTLDQADVIIPNADLVTSPVTNWTLSNRQVRLRIPVGVAYGSDVALVTEKLMACGKEHAKVIKYPLPQVLFLDFGESSLDFELRVWLVDAGERLTVRSELHHEIDRKFREANIEIAFPQRDLHLRTVDETLVLRSSESAGQD